MAVEAVTGAGPAWFVEFDAAPSKILAHHWPTVPNYGDVTAIDWSQVEPVDILTGGTPCQDLSHAGKRAGMSEGTRSNLWVNMREAIIHLNPQLVVWENVLGALSATATSDSDMEPGTGLLGDTGGGHLRALGRVLGDLAEIGYDAQWTTIRASDVGAPHHRARVFLVAWPSNSIFNPGHDAGRAEHRKQHEIPAARVGEPGQDPANSESCGRDHGAATHNGQADREVHTPRTDSDTAADAHSIRSQAGHQCSVGSGEEVPCTDGRGKALPDTGGEECSCGAGLRTEGQEEVRWGRPGDSHNQNVEWGDYAPAIRRWERIVGPAPAPTELNRNNKPRLNAAFAEWMMGLPAGWVTEVPSLSRAQQLKAIGNGVCPQQAAAALTELIGSNP